MRPFGLNDRNCRHSSLHKSARRRFPKIRVTVHNRICKGELGIGYFFGKCRRLSLRQVRNCDAAGEIQKDRRRSAAMSAARATSRVWHWPTAARADCPPNRSSVAAVCCVFWPPSLGCIAVPFCGSLETQAVARVWPWGFSSDLVQYS